MTRQFFPPEMSPFGYNETLAKEYFKMDRDVALVKNFRWQEKNTGTFGKETMPENTIPKNIFGITRFKTSTSFNQT